MNENDGGAGRFIPVSARAIVLRLEVSAVVCDPDKQSGPRRIEVPFFEPDSKITFVDLRAWRGVA